jgi:ribosomal protein L2
MSQNGSEEARIMKRISQGNYVLIRMPSGEIKSVKIDFKR